MTNQYIHMRYDMQIPPEIVGFVETDLEPKKWLDTNGFYSIGGCSDELEEMDEDMIIELINNYDLGDEMVLLLETNGQQDMLNSIREYEDI